MWDLRRIEDIGVVLRQIEEHLLQVTREGHTQVRRPEEVGRELVILARDVHQLFQRIEQRLEERDHTYDQESRLKEFRPRCLWLYRRAREEEFFVRELGLEADLRAQLSSEAFSIYQNLQAVQAEEEGFRGQDDEALTRLLTETNPVPGDPHEEEEESLVPRAIRP